MNARLSNRRVTFVPWTLEDLEGLIAKGKVWVEPEVGFLHNIDADRDGRPGDVAPDFSMVQPDGSGMVMPGDFIGASQAEIIEHTEEAAHAFAELAGITVQDEDPGGTEPPPAPGTSSSDSDSGICFIQTLLGF